MGRQCNRCLAGTMIVKWSRNVGDSQKQKRVCNKCGRDEMAVVPRSSVTPKPPRKKSDAKPT